ncbi:MAG TPA: DUF932 domain-containing protein, partial [Oceanospirillales bacterium]|nr:DUF932 domain-containing protein [Oceanospirillales bacterium]
ESTRTRNIIEQIYSNVVRSPGSQLETTHGTAWGVFNGISYYTDHQQGTNINNRAKGLLPGGTGHKMKMNALELLNMLPENISNEAYQTQNNALEILGMQ